MVEAFIQELADITLPEGEDNVPTSEDAKMEENVRRVLNENQGLVSCTEPIYHSSDKNIGLRPHGALPLVVMTPDDILAELKGIRYRSRNAEATERIQTEDFIRQIAARYVASLLYSLFSFFPIHSRPLHTALPHVYANSPLYSSPPFAFPSATQDLESCVRKTAGELQAIADSVEEEFKTTFAKDSNIKRLDTFVEKWIGK